MKIKVRDILIICFLLPSSMTFILECMVNNETQSSYILSTCLLLTPLIIAFLGLCGRAKYILKYSWRWLLYALAVVLALSRRSFAVSTVCDVTVILLTVGCIATVCMPAKSFNVGLNFLLYVGVFNAVGVLSQLLFGDAFNSVYWPLLTNSWQDYAERYYDMGYHTGFQAVPGIAAGAIMIALCLVVCRIILKSRHKQYIPVFKYGILIFMLIVSLLLTGKKGVLISGTLAILVMISILMIQKKQWIKLLITLIAVIVFYNLIKSFILSHPDMELTSRLASFFQAMDEGDQQTLTTGRNYLYAYALELWNKHKFWGIGWRAFRDATVYMFGYESKHDVNLDYLQFLCEAGLIGFTLMIIPIVVTLTRTIKLLKTVLKQSFDYETQFMVMVSGFLQFFITIYALFEIPFYDRTFFTVYAFSCIIINNAYRDIRRSGFIYDRSFEYNKGRGLGKGNVL